eukprot:s1156_g27.t1
MKTKKSSAKHEMKRESPVRGKMEMDELWLQVKKEIKEEMAKDMMSTNFESHILTQGVIMKEEVEVDAKGTQTCSSLQVAKRRRLTGGETPKIMKTGGPRCPSSEEKELADGVKVTKEHYACDMQETVNHKDRSCQILPCCPANLFLGSAIGTPSPPSTDAPACVLRLTGHGLRCLQRFHQKHSFAAFEIEAA